MPFRCHTNCKMAYQGQALLAVAQQPSFWLNLPLAPCPHPCLKPRPEGGSAASTFEAKALRNIEDGQPKMQLLSFMAKRLQ